MKSTHQILSLLLASASFALNTAAQEVVTIDQSLGQSVEFDETEGMTIRYDSLLNDWKVKMYLYTDSTCSNTEIDPTFPDSVYIDRLQRIPAVMELPYNHIVRQYIDRYTKRLRRQVSVMLGAGNFYFPIFEAELERYGLPLELKYLPVIESALKPKAVSPAGAGGLWQFMVGTGKQYGLKVNSVIDERCDPIKSSDAAARYLRDLYRIYHDWALVLAAYNCGPGNVNRAIHRAGARDYWQIYPFLPKETRGYVPAFIAATYAMTYYCEHGICPMRSRFPIATDTIIINRDISLRQISEVVGISLDVLKSLNPQYRTDRIPGKSQPCTLRMPDDMLHAFLDYGDDIYKYRASELLTRRAEVSVRGEHNQRVTAATTQPTPPAQNTMVGSEQPSIAETEAIVPTENTNATQTNTPSQPRQNAVTGEVTEVEIETAPASQTEENTTIIIDDDEDALRPVETNTQRNNTTTNTHGTTPRATNNANTSTRSNNTNTNTSNTNRSATAPSNSSRPANNTSSSTRTRSQQSSGSNSNSNTTTTNRSRSGQTTTSQQSNSSSSGTGSSGSRNRNRSSQATTSQQSNSSSNSTGSSGSRNRNRSSQATTSQQSNSSSSGTGSSGSRNRNRSSQATTSQQSNSSSNSTTGSSGSRNRSRSSQTTTSPQSNSSSNRSGGTTNRSNRSSSTQNATSNQTQSTNRSSSSSRNRTNQTTTSSNNSRNRNSQATTSSSTNKPTSGKSSSTGRNHNSSSNSNSSTTTPRSNRGTRPAGSGKAGSGKK